VRIDKYGNRATEIIDRMRPFYKTSPPPQAAKLNWHLSADFPIAGGGFEPPSFGLCDLTQNFLSFSATSAYLATIRIVYSV
jgi:hypothetical protein